MQPFLHDQWAPLNHKAVLGDGVLRPDLKLPTWVDKVDERRLAAYEILAAYRENLTRYHEPDPGSEVKGQELWRKLREYGHGALLVAQARALLLGDEQSVGIPDAQPVADDVDEQTKTTQARAARFEEWLRQWALDEHLTLKLLECEDNAIGDGDGVYALGWDAARSRPRLRVYDPGWYFPDLSEDTDALADTDASTDDEYPPTVHAAWEFEGKDGRAKLRRLTWQLTPLVDAAGKPARRPLPWGGDATVTCVYTDAVWDVGRLQGGETVYKLTSKPQTVNVDRVDLLVDFIPVVHQPNDAATKRHFGRSLITLIAQILDDLRYSDTDVAENSRLVASSPTVVAGGDGRPLQAGPGVQWNVDPDAVVTLLDTSKVLDANLKNDAHLLDDLAVNSRIAGALLGRVNPKDVPSGYAMELGFAPTRSLVGEMRAVRAVKHPLLLKFAMRLAQANGVLPQGDTPAAEIALGSFLPADQDSAVDWVTKLLQAKAISTLTAVRVLTEAGFPIDDAEEEVARINHENFTAAVELADATGDDAAVREFLGLQPAASLPPVQLPPQPPTPPQPPEQT